MEASPHRIRALRWQVRAGSPEEAFALRKRLRDDLHPVLLPAVARAFDEAGPAGGVLRIPRIEVSLEISATERFSDRLADLIRGRLRELLGRVATPADETTTFARITRDEDRSQQLARYLETGELAWPLAALEQAAILEELRLAAMRKPESVLDSPSLRGNGPEEQAVAIYFRLLQLLPEEEWEPIARAVAAKIQGELGEAIPRAIAALAAARSMSRYSRLKVAAVVLAMAGREAVAVPEEMPEEAPEEVPGEENVIALLPEAIARFFRERAALTPGPSPGRTPGPPGEGRVAAPAVFPSVAPALSEAEAMETRRDGSVKLSGSLTEKGAVRIDTGLESGEGGGSLSRAAGEGRGGGSGQPAQEALSPALPRADARGREPLPPTFTPGKWIPETAERVPSVPHRITAPTPESDLFPLSVRHAGLILLHPFLPRFFESTGALQEERLQRPRAAAQLHLLATGEEEVYELELGFIKVLLGMRPGEPLPISEGLLRDSDREEVEALLQAVLGHWNVLKKTSIAGLRQTFLQRSGLLREQDQGFLLQVEPEAFDMLLGQLPWGIGTVKLPWMKKPIFTEWPTL